MNLSLKPLMKATLTLHRSQLLKCNRWPTSLNPAKPLPNTSNTTYPACKALPKSMSNDTIILAYHLRRKKAVQNQTPVKELNHSNPSSTNRETNIYLMIKVQTSVPDVVIPHMHKDLIAQLRSIDVNIVQK